MAVQVMSRYPNIEWPDALAIVKKYSRDRTKIDKDLSQQGAISLTMINPANQAITSTHIFDGNDYGMSILKHLMDTFPPP